MSESEMLARVRKKRAERRKEPLEVTIKLSRQNEATSYPWWLIIDPGTMSNGTIGCVASMITGPFFSREAAEEYLDARRYAYSRRAQVYCHTGHKSEEWRSAVDLAFVNLTRKETEECSATGT